MEEAVAVFSEFLESGGGEEGFFRVVFDGFGRLYKECYRKWFGLEGFEDLRYLFVIRGFNGVSGRRRISGD